MAQVSVVDKLDVIGLSSSMTSSRRVQLLRQHQVRFGRRVFPTSILRQLLRPLVAGQRLLRSSMNGIRRQPDNTRR
jgi:hypothetical protein